jgi:hypothetical protein
MRLTDFPRIPVGRSDADSRPWGRLGARLLLACALIQAGVLARADGCAAPADEPPPPQIRYPACQEEEPAFDDSAWTLDDRASYLHFFGDDKLYIVPGRGLVYRLPEAQRRQAEPLLLGMAAHGSSATLVVRTQRGRAFLIDAGRNRTVSTAVHEYQLRQLAQLMGVRRLSHIHVSHAHDDHFNELRRLVREHRIPARNVVAPPLELPFNRGLANTWNRLAEELPQLGYRPVELADAASLPSVYNRSPNGQYYTARFRHGDTTVTYIANPRAIRELEERLAANPGARPGHAIDSSAAMMKLQKDGDPNAVVVLGDWRGEDILNIRDRMERERRGSFAEFFANVRLIKGLQHHMGVVRNANDLAGIKALLDVTTFVRGRLDVLVQTATHSDLCKGQLRPKLAEALAWLGARVTVTLSGDAETPSNVTATPAGEMTAQGPAVRQFRLAAADEARVGRMLEARAELGEWSRAFALNRDLMLRIFGAEGEAAEAAMNRARQRMRELSSQNRANTLDRLLTGGSGSRRINDAALFPEAELRRNIERMLDVHNGVRQHLEQAQMRETVELILRAGPVQYEVYREIRNALRNARGNRARLQELIETIDPQIRRNLLRRRANRGAVHHQLRNALISNRAFAAAGSGTPRGRAAVGASILILSELGSMALDANALYQEARHSDVGKQFSVLTWWVERGALPSMAGWIDNTEALGNRDKRLSSYAGIRAWLERDEIDGIEMRLDDSLDTWAGFYYWALSSIRSYDDYADHFVHAPQQTVAHYHTGAGGAANFPNGDWRYRELTWDPSAWTSAGARGENWVSHPTLNNIMREIMTRALDRTERTLTEVWAKREPVRPPPTGPAFTAPNTMLMDETMLQEAAGAHIGHLRPTARAHFRAGADRTLYSHFDPSHKVLQAHQWWSDNPYFLVFENSGAPDGYVAVAGADYNTYAAIRSAKTWQFDVGFDVHISPDRRDDTGIFSLPRPPEQEAALERARRDPNVEFLPSPAGDGSGTVRVWFDGPNHWGLGLVRKDALEPGELQTFPAFTEEETRIREGRSAATGTDESAFRAPALPACPEHSPPAPSRLAEPEPAETDCGRIDCDCNNVNFGLLTREFRAACRERENELKIHCELTGELLGSCNPAASGPDAWP